MSEWMAWAIMAGVVLVGFLCFWFSHHDSSRTEGRWFGKGSDHDVEMARAQAHAHNQQHEGWG